MDFYSRENVFSKNEEYLDRFQLIFTGFRSCGSKCIKMMGDVNDYYENVYIKEGFSF